MEKKEIVIKPGQRVVDWDFNSSLSNNKKGKYEDTWTEKSINFKQTESPACTSTAVPSAAAPSARRYSRLSIEALAVLKAAYNDKTRFGTAEKEAVAKNAGISVKKVDTWFC